MTDQREKEIQYLCESIIRKGVELSINSNSSYDTIDCPFCSGHKKVTSIDVLRSNICMEDINHDLDCIYLIAKDLSTNLT